MVHSAPFATRLARRSVHLAHIHAGRRNPRGCGGLGRWARLVSTQRPLACEARSRRHRTATAARPFVLSCSPFIALCRGAAQVRNLRRFLPARALVPKRVHGTAARAPTRGSHATSTPATRSPTKLALTFYLRLHVMSGPSSQCRVQGEGGRDRSLVDRHSLLRTRTQADTAESSAVSDHRPSQRLGSLVSTVCRR